MKHFMKHLLYSMYKPILFIKLLIKKTTKRPDIHSKKYYIKLANDIIAGKYNNGNERVQLLKQAGYEIDEIRYTQCIVNKSMGKKIKGIRYILIYLFS